MKTLEDPFERFLTDESYHITNQGILEMARDVPVEKDGTMVVHTSSGRITINFYTGRLSLSDAGETTNYRLYDKYSSDETAYIQERLRDSHPEFFPD